MKEKYNPKRFVKKHKVALIAAGAALALGASGESIGAAGTIRVPFTETNITFGAAIGNPAGNPDTLPYYAKVSGVPGGVELNESVSVGPIGEHIVFMFSRQPSAPIVNLHFNVTHSG